MKNTIKNKLRRVINEDEIPLVGAIPNQTYKIKIKGVDVGHVTISPNKTLGDDTAEIVDLRMIKDYNDLDTSIKAIRHIWSILPEVNRLVVNVNDDNQILWEKLNFQRLNNVFWYLMK